MSAAASLRIAELHVYPIKSCRGVRVESACVEPMGLAGDRRAVIADAREGRFVTQREEPRLALVAVRPLAGSRLSLSAPGMPDLALEPPDAALEPRAIRVWNDDTRARPSAEGSAWLSRYLRREVILAHLVEPRPVPPRWAEAEDVVSFADAFPILLASRGSLDDLSARAGVALEMERFRPNVVIAGSAPWAEDEWAAIRVGHARFRAPKPCDRCAVTTVDPRTGEMGKEPLRTLATFRRREGKVYFGINLIPDRTAIGAVLRTGDPVEVERRGNARETRRGSSRGG